MYQGLTEDSVPPLAETNNTNAPTPNNDDLANSDHLSADDDQLDEFKNLFPTPFHCGFRRKVDIDRVGDKTISYIAPDKVTRLESREAMEQFLDQNPYRNQHKKTRHHLWQTLLTSITIE